MARRRTQEKTPPAGEQRFQLKELAERYLGADGAGKPYGKPGIRPHNFGDLLEAVESYRLVKIEEVWEQLKAVRGEEGKLTGREMDEAWDYVDSIIGTGGYIRPTTEAVRDMEAKGFLIEKEKHRGAERQGMQPPQPQGSLEQFRRDKPAPRPIDPDSGHIQGGKGRVRE